MQARASVKSGAVVSKTFVAAVLVLVAIGLGIMAAFAAWSLSGRASSEQTSTISQPAAGTVLRQDNPAQTYTIEPAAGTVLHQDNPAQADGNAVPVEGFAGEGQSYPSDRGGHGQLP